jgi:beta-glucanase (GH16 family)
MKKTIATLVTLLVVGFAEAAVTNLFPNGDFDSPAGVATPWIEASGGGTTTYSYPTTGGNPGGYGRLNNASGWGIWVGQVSPTAGYAIAPLGLVAGGNYDFVMDMKNFSGTGIGKLKIECWAGGVRINEGPEISASAQSGSWVTYTFNRTLVAGTTDIMIVPVAGAGSSIGYDNIGVVVTNSSTPLTVSITSPANSAVVTSNYTINATATVSPGTVTNVAFYDGVSLLGNDPSSPFSLSVSGAVPGAHALTAVARSSSGNSATSAVVNIIVSNPPAPAGWQLVWADEFTQANGSSPDSAKWNYDIGTGSGGWGNNELQYYTSRTNNVRIENEQLVIEATAENYMGSSYTSARLLTQGKWSWTYGRMEARIKVPRTQGIWPAFWMLGTNIPSVGWPLCGEIDIMEHIGREPKIVYGTVHGPGYSGGGGVSGSYTFVPDVADDFHVFAVEWQTNVIRWYVDGINYFTVTPANIGGNTWVFNQPQFFLLNVAVGGNWPGYPDGTTVFPQKMLVDYVRVYNYVPAAPAPPTEVTASPGSAKVYLKWDAVSGATAYHVKRATTSGGPYTTIASPAVNNYTDAGVANCSTYYYVVSATNSLGASTNSLEQTATLGAYALAVNSGGSAVGQFGADANVAGGTIGGGTTAAIDTTGLVAPAPQSVYQAERYGNMTYTFPGLIAGATYKVRLHSAETYWTAVGQRRFNVTINGTPVLTNFDIIAAAGAANKAVINEFNAVATGGQITIQYVTVTDNARASGIEIILARPAAPAGLGAIAGNAQVSLNWNAITGATYNVKRSLASSGPFTTVFSGLASTNSTDAGLTNGVTYYYVVSAAVLGCESTNSSFLSATPVCAPPPAPTASNNGPIWAGMTLNLTASTVPGAAYAWTGPNGFTSTNQNPSILNVSTNTSGLFSVIATAGGCSSSPATTAVLVNPPASLAIQVSAGSVILNWPGGTLQSTTNLSGPWSDISGATSPRTNPVAAAQEFYRIRLQ